MKYELQKILHQKKIFLIAIPVLLIIYVYFTFYQSLTTYTGYSLENFWENEEFRTRQMSKSAEVVDEEYIRNTMLAYRQFVDENILSDEEVEKNIQSKNEEGFELDYTAQEAMSDRYNIYYAFGLLKDEAYYSETMSDYFDFFKIYIPLAQDPVTYMHDRYDQVNDESMEKMGITYWSFMGYSESQLNDYWKVIDSYSNKQLVIGYSLGWDILCQVMQYLPFTLGIALIIILSNLFFQESSSGMDQILKTTKNGRKKLLKQKIGAAFLITTVLWILFQGCALLSVALRYTLQGGSVTPLLIFSSPNIYFLSWSKYYLLSCIFSYLGTLVFALFICCLSSFMKLRFSMPIALIFVLMTGSPMQNFIYSEKAFSLFDHIVALTPTQLLSAYPAFQIYQSYSIGSLQIQLPYMMGLAMIIEFAVFLMILQKREG